MGYELRPPRLEALARHHTVLNGEQRHQQQIDDHGFGGRRVGPGVDGLRHHQPHHKADRVDNRNEKNEIRRNSVKKGDELENA
ncbi:hypothetical protein ACVWYH_002982 [Bradyrhizobium sp. GM24.11]